MSTSFIPAEVKLGKVGFIDFLLLATLQHSVATSKWTMIAFSNYLITFKDIPVVDCNMAAIQGGPIIHYTRGPTVCSSLLPSSWDRPLIFLWVSRNSFYNVSLIVNILVRNYG